MSSYGIIALFGRDVRSYARSSAAVRAPLKAMSCNLRASASRQLGAGLIASSITPPRLKVMNALELALATDIISPETPQLLSGD